MQTAACLRTLEGLRRATAPHGNPRQTAHFLANLSLTFLRGAMTDPNQLLLVRSTIDDLSRVSKRSRCRVVGGKGVVSWSVTT